MNARAISPDTFRFTLVLGLLAALPSLSIDISAPTLLTVQRQLQSTSGTVGLTITLFMLGFALGQFGAGPLSDRYGRRPVLLSGLGGYTLAALGCSLSATASALVSWRLLQGVAAGACAVLAFTMIRDLFEGDAARVKRSYVTVVFGLAPMLAPGLGAWILNVAGWRLVFIILSAAGALLLTAVTFYVAESRTAPSAAMASSPIRSAYSRVLANRRFVGLAAVNALSFGAMFAYIAGSPMVLMGDLHLSPSGYSVVFACTAASLTMGAWVSGRCASAGVGPRSLLWVSLALAAASAVALALLLAIDVRSLFLLFPLLLVNLFCRGMVAPTAQHMALEPMRDQAGTAAATVGVMQILTGALSSAFVAVLMPYLGPLGMTGVMATLALASLGLWLWMSLSSDSAIAGAALDA
jgi:DHA1 family bicyclomycin/chloramphenicol resistance-like MFS transporter